MTISKVITFLLHAPHHQGLRIGVVFSILLGLLLMFPVGVGYRCFLWFFHSVILPIVVITTTLRELSFERKIKQVLCGAVIGGLLSLSASTVSNVASFVSYLFFEGQAYVRHTSFQVILLVVWSEVWLTVFLTLVGAANGGFTSFVISPTAILNDKSKNSN